MDHYLLALHQPVGTTEADRPGEAELAEIMRRVDEFNADLKAAGSWVFAGGLDSPSTAVMLRASESDVLVTDGPFTEGKEYVAGLSIIAAEDLATAREWGSRLARITGLGIEVRPFAAAP